MVNLSIVYSIFRLNNTLKVIMNRKYVSGFIEVGGYTGVMEKFPVAVPELTKNYSRHPYLAPKNLSQYVRCGIPPSDSFHLFRAHDSGDLPWPGIVFGLTISAVWYWCTDQVDYLAPQVGLVCFCYTKTCTTFRNRSI